MGFCPQCGNALAEDARFCPRCGFSAQPGAQSNRDSPGVYSIPATNGKAIASLALGLFFLIPFLSVIAVVLGHLALSEIRKSAGTMKGEGLAVAGLVLGYIGSGLFLILIVAAIAIPNLLRARIAANEAAAVQSIRTLNQAEARYLATHPGKGYTCELSELEASQLIFGPLTSGSQDGYSFQLQNCSLDAYQVVAIPMRRNTTGVRAFCSDQQQLVRVDSGGSPDRCLNSGLVSQ
jgi:type IV pilus assembly protein PilA